MRRVRALPADDPKLARLRAYFDAAVRRGGGKVLVFTYYRTPSPT